MPPSVIVIDEIDATLPHLQTPPNISSQKLMSSRRTTPKVSLTSNLEYWDLGFHSERLSKEMGAAKPIHSTRKTTPRDATIAFLSFHRNPHKSITGIDWI
jgi:hypothetical protein